MRNTIYPYILAAATIAASSTLTAKEADPTPADLERIAISDTMVMVPMSDGVRLATDVYRPKEAEEPVPVILMKTPYNFNKVQGFQLKMVYEGVRRGFAVVIQNERGRYYSEGEWEILGHPRSDGYDSVTWLAEQEWSNGNVGTLGCSSSAEWQLALAAQNHPAHKAMVPMAAGAGIGRVGPFMEQGNWYKGGVHQTLFSVWLFYVQQNQRPRFPDGLGQEELQRLRKLYDLAPEMPEVEWKNQLRELPATSWLDKAGANSGPALELLRRTPADPAWLEGGLYHDNEDFGVPALWFNSWFDVSQGPNVAMFNHARHDASDPVVREGQYMVIAPTMHCGFFSLPTSEEPAEDLVVGELNVGPVRLDTLDLVFGWFDHFLRDGASDFLDEMPRVKYYTMGSNEWNTAEEWPPAQAGTQTLYLASGGKANSLYGDGELVSQPRDDGGADQFIYDPMNPVPSLGGAVCCNAGAALGGSYDQRGIEARADVLVYTGDPLAEDVEVTGSVQPVLYVSSDAPDTDFTVKLVDVHPDGAAWNVDDTILRARYRDGYHRPAMMEPGEVYELRPTPMTTSYRFKAGHRIRVEVSSSKFPQYMRNLNTGGANVDETEGVVARNSVHHTPSHPSRIEMSVMPAD
jgi:putative CocE/NonD family hydrolase